jgi:hypothetical protein
MIKDAYEFFGEVY